MVGVGVGPAVGARWHKGIFTTVSRIDIVGAQSVPIFDGLHRNVVILGDRAERIRRIGQYIPPPHRRPGWLHLMPGLPWQVEAAWQLVLEP